MTSYQDWFTNSKVAKVLSNHKTDLYEKCKHLSVKLDTHTYRDIVDKLLDEAAFESTYRKLTNQAKTVLSGKCPHKNLPLGIKTITVSPRNWLSYTEEVCVYSKCLWCEA